MWRSRTALDRRRRAARPRALHRAPPARSSRCAGPSHCDELPGEVGADHVEGAVREIEHPQHAEDQRQARRDQEQEHRGGQAADELPEEEGRLDHRLAQSMRRPAGAARDAAADLGEQLRPARDALRAEAALRHGDAQSRRRRGRRRRPPARRRSTGRWRVPPRRSRSPARRTALERAQQLRLAGDRARRAPLQRAAREAARRRLRPGRCGQQHLAERRAVSRIRRPAPSVTLTGWRLLALATSITSPLRKTPRWIVSPIVSRSCFEFRLRHLHQDPAVAG